MELETSTTFVPPPLFRRLVQQLFVETGTHHARSKQLAVFVHQISPREPFTVILTVDSNERR